MGVIRFLCRVSNPTYLAKDIRKAILEEGTVSQGLKQIGKETLMDQIPFSDVIHKQGEFVGERKGIEKNSTSYEEKFNDQMEYFLEQKQIYETEIEGLNLLLDECDIRISQYEAKYGTDINDIPEEDKEKLLKLYSDQRKLEQLKKREVLKDKPEITPLIVKDFINQQIGMLEEKIFKWFDSIEKIEDINKKMKEYKDECVLYFNPYMTKSSSKKGMVFGMKGLMYLEEDRYVKYKHISDVSYLKFPAALKISVTDNRAIVAELYIHQKLADVINTLCLMSEKSITEMESDKYKTNANEAVRRLVESAWKMADYPGELVCDEERLHSWYKEYSTVGGFSEFVQKNDIVAKFRHNYFNIIFAYEGFIFENEKKPIYVLYTNVEEVNKNEDCFTIKLVEGSVLEIENVSNKFLYLCFKRIMEFHKSKLYYNK